MKLLETCLILNCSSNTCSYGMICIASIIIATVKMQCERMILLSLLAKWL